MAAPNPSLPTPVRWDDGWPRIKDAIQRLENALDTNFQSVGTALFDMPERMALYTACYQMCVQHPPDNFAAQLYEQHGKSVTQYLEEHVLPALQSKSGMALLQELDTRWRNHQIMTRWLHKFFQYLDRYHIKVNDLPPLNVASLTIFKNQVFDNIATQVVAALLQAIDAERDRTAIVDTSLLRRCADIFVALGQGNLDYYVETLQIRLVENTREYYRRASQNMSSQGTPVYLAQAEDMLESEKARVNAYLHPTSEEPILREATSELLRRPMQQLLDREGSGAYALLVNEKRDDLARMYRLFRRVDDGLPHLANIVQRYFSEKGLEIVRARDAEAANPANANKDPADSPFVQELLKLHSEARSLVINQFQGNSLFDNAVKDAFELFVNKEVTAKVSNVAMIALFCDKILKSGGVKLGDDELEELLEHVVHLFTFITDKDLFASMYRDHLAKRLLNQRSASDSAERSMISKLKLRCGAQFTSKMEGMLADLAVGADHQRAFERYLETIPPMQFQFSVQVLTTGFWPSYKPVDVALPVAMQDAQQLFRTYYDSKTSHRKLTWVHTLGTATLKAMFDRSYELQVTTLQAVALLLFNHATGPMSFEDIRSSLNCDESVVKRVLHSLACGKYQILDKEPNTRVVAETDTFSFNSKFTCSFRKIRVPMASLDDTHNPKRVQEDRSIAIEAAAVRTMKTRKVMSHQELVMEIIQQLHFFKPNPKIIKRRIEHLIEREYLERDPDKPNMYRYVA